MLPALFNSALRQQETAIRSTLTALCNQLHSALADAAQSPPAASSTQCRRYAWSAAAAKRPRRPRVDPKLPDSIFAPQPASPLTKVEPGVLPEQLVEELQTYETKFHKEANTNGWVRMPLSVSELPKPIPHHDIEPGLLTIKVHLREASGSIAAKWIRRGERTPGVIQHVWSYREPLFIHMSRGDAHRLVTRYGRFGCQGRIVVLQIVDPMDETRVLGRVRAKPQFVHMGSYKELIENIEFLYCPQDKMVKVNVMVQIVNDDIAPGTKEGGWMHVVKKRVKYLCPGHSVLPFIEIDCRNLSLNQTVCVKDLPIPFEGIQLLESDPDAVVVRCTTDAGN